MLMVSNAHWAWWFAVDNVDDGGVKVQEDDDDVDDDNDIDDDDDGGGGGCSPLYLRPFYL